MIDAGRAARLWVRYRSQKLVTIGYLTDDVNVSPSEGTCMRLQRRIIVLLCVCQQWIYCTTILQGSRSRAVCISSSSGSMYLERVDFRLALFRADSLAKRTNFSAKTKVIVKCGTARFGFRHDTSFDDARLLYSLWFALVRCPLSPLRVFVDN